jgi:hypothetical protein
MQAPDPVETILARLMPAALSQNGQSEIDEMIDDLARPEVEPISSGLWLGRWMIGGGIAAVAAGLLAALPLLETVSNNPSFAAHQMPAGIVLVSESDRIGWMTDEGWQESADGSAMHALRVSAVEENKVRDEESGMVVQISEPREEIFLTPISAF